MEGRREGERERGREGERERVREGRKDDDGKVKRMEGGE